MAQINETMTNMILRYGVVANIFG